MLVWDEQRGGHDAAATLKTDHVALRDHYVRVLREGLAGQALGEPKLF